METTKCQYKFEPSGFVHLILIVLCIRNLMVNCSQGYQMDVNLRHDVEDDEST